MEPLSFGCDLVSAKLLVLHLLLFIIQKCLWQVATQLLALQKNWSLPLLVSIKCGLAF